MAQGNFSSLRDQARYIDEVISDLDLKLANPGRIFQPSKVAHTEKILENIMAENEGILQNINGEREIAVHNIQEQEKFLHKVNEDIVNIIKEQSNLEEQLRQYGYIPMPETPTTAHKNEGDNNDMVDDECTGSGTTSYAEQLEGISLGTDVGMQYRSPQPTKPLDPVFSKYSYEALGMPVPPEVLNITVNRTYN